MKNLQSLKPTRTFAVRWLCAVLLAASVAHNVSAQTAPAAGTIRYNAQPLGGKVKIAGTSTIHDWTMDSTVIGGYIEADAKFPESALTDPKAAKPKVEVLMPVRQFKSYSTAMDKVMQDAMTETTHKRIEFRLIGLKPKSAAGATGVLQFDATGTLTVAGVTKTNTFPVTIEKKDGKLLVNGTANLKMTDFGVKPPAPTVGLGMIKTGDDIKVTFDWTTAPKAP